MMSKVTMADPISVKKESQPETKDLSLSFKSLKRSLKETLERLETIGINDIDLNEESLNLKSIITQKNKTIEDQAKEIERLSLIIEQQNAQM
jgi:vacuolar-type H+-ATPase subunit I/STV1